MDALVALAECRQAETQGALDQSTSFLDAANSILESSKQIFESANHFYACKNYVEMVLSHFKFLSADHQSDLMQLDALDLAEAESGILGFLAGRLENRRNMDFAGVLVEEDRMDFVNAFVSIKAKSKTFNRFYNSFNSIFGFVPYAVNDVEKAAAQARFHPHKRGVQASMLSSFISSQEKFLAEIDEGNNERISIIAQGLPSERIGYLHIEFRLYLEFLGLKRAYEEENHRGRASEWFDDDDSAVQLPSVVRSNLKIDYLRALSHYGINLEVHAGF